MRPPHCAGEDGLQATDGAELSTASMRPPHCAGEDVANAVPATNAPTLLQ